MNDLLRLLRLKYSWSMEELAKRAGTSAQQIDRLEKKTRGFTKIMAINVAAALGIQPHLLDPEHIYTAEEMDILNCYRRLTPEAKKMAIGALKGMFSDQIELTVL